MFELDIIDTVVMTSSDLTALAITHPEKAAVLVDYSIKKQVNNERESWIQRANMIFFLKQNDLWQHHPSNFKSFYDYCSQSDVGISASVASDMIALCTFAPILLDEGIDIWEEVRKSGPSKIRQIIPQIKEAYRNGVIAEEVGPVIASLSSITFRDVIGMTGTSNVRSVFELEAYYHESSSGEISIEFRNLDVDDLEYLVKKASIKKWYDEQGLAITSPLKPEVKALK